MEYLKKFIKKIDQFPTKRYFKSFDYDKKMYWSTCKFWIKAQEKINTDKKLRFFKTHNVFGKLNNYDFTNRKFNWMFYVVRDPRNVFTSLKNHYQLDDDQGIKWITMKKIIFMMFIILRKWIWQFSIYKFMGA